MSFDKKMKIRLWMSVIMAILGVSVVVCSYVFDFENEFFKAYGFALFACGIIRVIQDRRMCKSEEAKQNREIAEKDERNISIAEKAGAAAYRIYCVAATVPIIVLEAVGEVKLATFIAFSVCALLLIYIVAYRIIAKKM